MNKNYLKIAFIACICLCIIKLPAQAQYSDYKTMAGKAGLLAKQYPDLCTVKSLTKTAGGKEILLITVGTGNKDEKPGIAVLGGVDGSHPLGKELASGFAESIIRESASEDIKKLLDKVTFYIFPDVSPDATEQFFSAIKYERNINARSTDDDRDFKTDEDPFEDLDKDGYISFVRVEDPAGKYIKNKDDERIMSEADISKGQTGNYLVIAEGIDNDKDQKFNEDGEGGVNFNSNFTYNYEEFGANAGLHPVSEPETKAIADFLYDRFNIYAVFTFGPQDNLGQPLKSEKNERRITSIMKSDEPINKLLSDKYHEITGMKGAPASKNTPGNFMEWAYYHYGRFSFSTPGWWFPVEKGKDASVEFMKYAEKNNLENVFIPWKEINHPDFPGKKAEAGGIKPFAMTNPPADSLAILIKKNTQFITAAASMHPELEFLDVKTMNAGDNIFRITLKVHNKGVFPTVAEAGDFNTWTRIMRISLALDKSQTIVSGLKVQRIRRLGGNESSEFSWLINGKGSVNVTAGAVNTGIITSTISLR